MSKSVDDAVCDYFSLLLNEPAVELSKVETAKASRPEKEPVHDEAFSRQALEQLFAKAQTKDATAESVSSLAVKASTSQTDMAEVIEQGSSALLQPVIEPIDNDSRGEATQRGADNLDAASQAQITAAPIASEQVKAQITSTQTLLDKLDEEFQVLFFNVAGLTLAVPLVSLGGIVNLEKVTSLIGRPDWYLGVQQYRDAQLNVVDTCAWVMPEKYDAALAEKVNYQYVVVLEDSHWGLGCESLINTINIKKSEVNWRSQAGKRPWLAGVVKEQMCGILNVEALVQMLGAGMGCQDTVL
ncbi:chemotaxis protein CheW [Shewanella sp. MBTL60-007]|uniref:chemotaxis protein CheW n=1 Tax=Shewanella sp. MBTL60-007 TaxID=2815911 RepID=UPI001BC12D6C|nr:chemotaxis protein CheW [Shewanella sp. MBTL60-007]GIU20254.1 chemotaxis protein CheW [Shewanella sp. MBTL60-007]